MRRLRERDGRCACVGLHGGDEECPTAVAVRLLAAPYALDVVTALAEAPAPIPFGELRRRLDLAPNTLSRRLRALRDAGVAESAPSGYRITRRGARLWALAQTLGGWREADPGSGPLGP